MDTEAEGAMTGRGRVGGEEQGKVGATEAERQSVVLQGTHERVRDGM